MAALNLRAAARASMLRVRATVEAEGFAPDLLEMEHLLAMLDAQFDRFSQHHQVLVGAAKAEELEAHDLLLGQMEAIYSHVALKLRRMRAVTPGCSDGASRAPSESRLDPIKLPVFDGRPENWLVFKDLFESLVHNRTDVDPTYKLSRLRQCVREDAVPMVGGVYTGGYDQLWQDLKRRYDNPRRLVEAHVNRLFDLGEQPPQTQTSIRNVIDVVRSMLRALKVMALPTEQWDAILYPILLRKLPSAAVAQWRLAHHSDQLPNLTQMLEEFEVLADTLQVETTTPSRRQASGRSAQAHVVTSSTAAANQMSACPQCGEPHRLSKCQQFRALSGNQRWNLVRQASLCYNCLGTGHSARQCTSGSCHQCKQKHNTLLCKATGALDRLVATPLGDQRDAAPPPPMGGNSATITPRGTGPHVLPRFNNAQAFLAHSEGIVLLATAKASILDGCGDEQQCRLLCDMGSQVSFVTETFFNRLNLRRKRHVLSVEGIGAQTSTSSSGQATLTLRSLFDPDFETTFDAHILPAITTAIPATPVDVRCCELFQHLQLADPAFHTPGRIDVLIGADVWGMLLLGGVVSCGPGQPCALHTRLGWVICGPATSRCVSLPAVRTRYNPNYDEERLDDLLKRFWELEEVPHPPHKADDCDDIFQQTFTRNPDGRYVSLGDSHTTALRQFLQLERRLSKDAMLRQRYIQFMREYESLGHMEKVAAPYDDVSPTTGYIIPHHAVTAKFRVVFNASAKTTTGISLNDTQLVGPQLQEPLVNILHRFRRFRIAITADVEKMFRQIQVDPRHRQWQQILWRESPDVPLHTYQLTTVTYGMACSPYNAIRALRQCAEDNFHVIPDGERAAAARHSILQNFYVDDFLDSAPTSTKAITLARDITKILAQGKFSLRKWNSNATNALNAITTSGSAASELTLGESDAKVLGLYWHPGNDELLFKTQLTDIRLIPTKRIVLSDVAKLFDPIGLLAPVTVTAKIFMQRTWAAKMDWDTPLPPDLREEWLKFRSAFPAIVELRIPRWLGATESATISMHGFCDASTKAYAAVIYVRCVEPGGQTRVALVNARTKVAPLKSLTIPRLELCAAHLLVNSMITTCDALQLGPVECTYWSDSSVVLAWIRRPPTTFQQYVSSRVAFIRQHSDVSRWYHIRSADNPADCASRGLSPAAIGQFSLWWEGPQCIHEDGIMPLRLPHLGAAEQEAHDAELRPLHTHLSTIKVPKLQVRLDDRGTTTIPLVERFSTLQRLLHTTAYVLRFRPAGRPNRHAAVLTADEIQQAFLLHIREAQGNFYSSELNHLQSIGSVAVSSKLLPLNPVLDDSGVLRVGGRLSHAELSYEQRHPMIVPKKSALATLIVNNAHRVTLHGGIRVMLQYLRRQVWIVHARALVKRCIHSCKTCQLHQRAMQQQQMADLPRSRVTVAAPFSNTGLDYAGPFYVRHGGKRSITTTKTYAALFVCMCTKAVHIELAEDLSTRAFLDVFDRFVNRRGYCANLYSDNGTQFVGADRLLRADFAEWHSAHSQQQLSDVGVRWHFITPAAPHHGGLWEAAVRSAKKHLLRVVSNQHLTFSQLSTLLVRIEACLNSRPLVAIHDDPEGGTALSPGDFLIGRPLNARPEPTAAEIPVNRLRYHQRLQRMYQHFWRRWQEEYLTQLQSRSKWARPVPNLQVGDVVALKQEHLPPSRWRIGRITEVHPGSDGLVRVVTVEYCSEQLTSNGMPTKHRCQRAVQRVCRIVEAGERVLNPSGSAGEDVRE